MPPTAESVTARLSTLACLAFVVATLVAGCSPAQSGSKSGNVIAVDPGSIAATAEFAAAMRPVLNELAAAEDAALRAQIREQRPSMPLDVSSAQAFERWRAASRSAIDTLFARPDDAPPLRPRWLLPMTPFAGLEQGVVRYALDDTLDTVAVLTQPSGPGPHPTVVLLHGHTDLPFNDLVDPATHELAELALARAGFVVIRPVIRTFSGPVAGYWQHRKLAGIRAALGEPLLPTFVADCRRTIDLLEALAAETSIRADVSDLTVAGHSLGAAIALITSVVDERVDRAIVQHFAGPFADALASVEHCGCGFWPEVVSRWNPVELAALLAPRPMLLVAASDDPNFPIAEPQLYFGPLAAAYQLAGQPEALTVAWVEGGHKWRTAPAIEWLSRHRP